MSVCNIRFLSKSTFYRNQRKYLWPVVNNRYLIQQREDLQLLRGQPLVLAGDDRCDSPGNNAKYGTYSVMEVTTEKIVDFSLVQVSEVANSNAMEKEGLTRCLEFLERDGQLIDLLATDSCRNDEARKGPKSVRKDLVAASKKRECTELASWTASVVNHLWWCAATSHGDHLLCQEKWKSIIYHVAGIHEWPDFQLFSACGHDELTNQQRRNKVWLPIGSPSHNALKEVAWKPKLLKDICLPADFVQTGCLEVFHGSMAKKYVNKSQHYSYSGMVSRTQLVVIDHNCNVGRGVATTASGDERYKCVYPKLQKQ
ncbi:uncharacterized protein LOC122952240 [Acropora millepora]|uniref:uncharacterized protein LOC122952240 n=1 Tax=Acropora millepora TaxID=45264 RepID=UPI001CF3D4F3|nr:uncharacterized protein LOC122952240 [Acropora millepora]